MATSKVRTEKRRDRSTRALARIGAAIFILGAGSLGVAKLTAAYLSPVDVFPQFGWGRVVHDPSVEQTILICDDAAPPDAPAACLPRIPSGLRFVIRGNDVAKPTEIRIEKTFALGPFGYAPTTDRLELRVQAHSVERIDILVADRSEQRATYRCDIPEGDAPTLLRFDYRLTSSAGAQAGIVDFQHLRSMTLIVYPRQGPGCAREGKAREAACATPDAVVNLTGILAQTRYVDALHQRTDVEGTTCGFVSQTGEKFRR